MEMADLADMMYDKPRRWIKDSRENNISWEEIGMGRKKNFAGLQNFLDLQQDMNFWPPMSISDWQMLVQSEKNAEERHLVIEMLDGIAHIHDSGQNNAVTIPQDEMSSWQLYRKKLLTDGFKEETVDEIERTTLKILKRLNGDTTNSDPVKGLVIGNVQSGKTANMAALMAMAADWGWNMFIVLSGTIENLRVQTQSRLFNDLNQQGTLWWRPLQHLSKTVDISQRAQSLHFDPGSKERYFTVCLKNSTRLKKLIQWAQADKNKQRQMKILVIDDEADQAGINTAKIEQEERKKINKLICALVNGQNEKAQNISTKYLAMNYIGYTATPYANILNEAGKDSLYPRSFITTLAVSKEYFGPQQIFGYSGDSVSFDGMDIVRIIGADELETLKSIHEGDVFTAPESLLDAVCWFMCGVSCMRIWGYKKPISMLIHTSQKTAHHSAVAAVMSRWISGTPAKEIIKRAERVWYEETSRFSFESFREQYPTYDRPDDSINRYPDFLVVKEQLAILLDGGISHIELDSEGELTYHKGIHLCVDNCTNNGVTNDGMYVRLAYPDPADMPSPAPAFIVVGGATLSRGLTIEGLISTFFLRSVGQADTLMQMGRWFGYRKKYELLPRLWITDKTREQFRFLAALDQELRDEILNMDILGRSPAEYGPKVKNSPKVSFIRITAKNRMQAATEAEMDYSGASNQTYLFDNDAQKLRENIQLTEEFVGGLGTHITPLYFPNNALWRNVSFSRIRTYIEQFHFCDRLQVFSDTRPLMDWIGKMTSEGKLGNWNVIVAGKTNNTNGDWRLPDGRVIYKVNRSRKLPKNETDDAQLDIGVLRDPMDLLADVDVDAIEDSDTKRLIQKAIASGKAMGAAGLRDKSGLNMAPQLLIYRVDKNSMAKEKGTRRNLEASEDLIGISIYIPGGRIGTSYASAVRIKMNNDIFDGDPDLEGTDEY